MISIVDKVIIIYIYDKTSFVSLSSKKYLSMVECHFLWANNSICDFIASLSGLTALELVLDKYEYLILLCIGKNNEHPFSFVDGIDGEVMLK